MAGRARGNPGGRRTAQPRIPGQPRTEYTPTTLTKSERRRLEVAAHQHGLSVSFMVRKAVVEFLDRRDITDPKPEPQMTIDDGRAA